jgi:hypothetical protein
MNHACMTSDLGDPYLTVHGPALPARRSWWQCSSGRAASGPTDRPSGRRLFLCTIHHLSAVGGCFKRVGSQVCYCDWHHSIRCQYGCLRGRRNVQAGGGRTCGGRAVERRAGRVEVRHWRERRLAHTSALRGALCCGGSAACANCLPCAHQDAALALWMLRCCCCWHVDNATTMNSFHATGQVNDLDMCSHT